MKRHTQVLIVGAGPVGLALAGDLAWRGIESVVVERRDATIFQPRMDMVGVRTMEFCRRWGIVEDVQTAGYNRQYVQDCAWVTDLNGLEFGREPFLAPAKEPAPPQSPQNRERCPQNFFDPVLRRFASRTGLVTFAQGTEFLSFVDQGDRVTASLRSVADGTGWELDAEYLVGADGGDSAVRSNLGIQMVGEGTLTYTTNAIFRCDGLEQLHTTRPAYRYIFIGPEGTWATLVAINGRDQWRFSLIGDHTRRQASEAEMIEAITRAVGRDFEFEVLSILPWQRRQLVAEHYGKGRVFLAGDSAHLTSPTGGFGMNTGILDAVNLSWKLAASIQGWGSQTLLDSYEAEQRPVAERNVGEASENLRRMLAPRVASPDPQLFDLSDISEATMSARRAFGDSYTEAMSREWHTIGIHLGYVYEDSPVILGDDTPAPKLAVSTYEQSARPGSRAPHAWLDETRTSSVIDLFGREFVLLRFDGSIDTLSFERAAEHLGVPLVTIDINDSEIAALYARKLVLVRPDGQVCWRGDSADQAASVVSRVTGHPTHPASSEVAPVLSGTA